VAFDTTANTTENDCPLTLSEENNPAPKASLLCCALLNLLVCLPAPPDWNDSPPPECHGVGSSQALKHASYGCTCVLDASLIWAGQSGWEDTAGISFHLCAPQVCDSPHCSAPWLRGWVPVMILRW